jgi:hypothetical protein
MAHGKRANRLALAQHGNNNSAAEIATARYNSSDSRDAGIGLGVIDQYRYLFPRGD